MLSRSTAFLKPRAIIPSRQECAITISPESQSIDRVLDSQSVVITGSGSGLGRAYAHAAAEAGAQVVVNDIDPAAADTVVAEIQAAGGVAVAHPADISDWDAAGGLIDRCVKEFGRIDGLVNNAGIFALALPQDQRPEPLRRLLDVNVFGTAACGHHAIRHMVAQGGGRIVNVTSGEQMGKTSSAGYAATKGAVSSLTYSWSVDLAEHGIRVNAISPNAETGMSAVYLAYRGSQAGAQNSGLPPAVNAPLVVYLLSELSAPLTGQIVRLNNRDLMLCTHPAVLEPVISNSEAWTVRSIADTFDSQLKALAQPVGIHVVQQQVQG